MKNFRTINNILGWFTFLIAAITYMITLEDTVSFWDCGEFIACANKLQVGHPPGAPLYLMFARFFALFAPAKDQVAFFINSFSAITSALTILFLFFTIVLIANKLIPQAKEQKGFALLVCGAALVGSLAYTFTDSFWFSAVEGEVYAFSSLFTAVVFWAVLKWEEQSETPYANRWLILIAYLIGLSIGVHLLSLLVIPPIVFVIYLKKYNPTWKGILAVFLLSIIILSGIQYVVIPGIPGMALSFDRFFVNQLGLPFNSGLLSFVLLLLGILIYGVYYSIQKKKIILNTGFLMLIVIIIGYSSYALIVIRSSANPSINENEPDNAFSLVQYLNREQYGSRPLLYGQYYSAPVESTSPRKEIYGDVNGKYGIKGTLQGDPNYDSRFCTVFPRMYSSESRHVRAYKEWGKIEGKDIRVVQKNEVKKITKPTFVENIRFFVSYQLGHMYFRYFLWNFVGRQNDVQADGSIMYGNWISGISAFDEVRLGPQDELPPYLKNHPSRNTYYFLPLILGLLGMVFQLKKGKEGKKSFSTVMLLFVFTGIAIVVYLNQTPLQPRERDYAYVGSFYAFSIWIGLGVLAFYEALRKAFKNKVGVTSLAIGTTTICLLAAPVLLASENWHDHDRSNRFTARDYAKNYLASCAPNAILFVYADNDTFPLWYVQEVEGFRTDVRICNISLLDMDWYVDQMRRKMYDSDPVPFTFDSVKYRMGTRDVIPMFSHIDKYVELDDVMEFVGSDDDRTRIKSPEGDIYDYIPTKKLCLDVDSSKVIKNGTVSSKDADKIVPRLEWTIKRNYLTKSTMCILNMLAANDWERPIYFDLSVVNGWYLNLNDYLQLEGLAYRLVPIQTNRRKTGQIDTEILYRNVMEKFSWGNLNDPDVYVDNYNEKEISIIQAVSLFSQLANALMTNGENEKAMKVLDEASVQFPNSAVRYDFEQVDWARAWYRLGKNEKGNDIIKQIASNTSEDIRYYLSLPEEYSKLVDSKRQRSLSILENLMAIAKSNQQNDLAGFINNKIDELIKGK